MSTASRSLSTGIIPASIGAAIAPLYLLTTDYRTIAAALSIQGAFAGPTNGINPDYANERFLTGVRATAAAFCCSTGAVAGRFVPPVPAWFAARQQMGFATPMLIGTVGGPISVVAALFFGPETKGKEMEADPSIPGVAELP